MNCTLLDQTFLSVSEPTHTIVFSSHLERSFFVGIPTLIVYPLALGILCTKVPGMFVNSSILLASLINVITSFLLYSWFEVLKCDAYDNIDHLRFVGTIGIGILNFAFIILARFGWKYLALIGFATINSGVIVIDYYQTEYLVSHLTTESMDVGSRILYLLQLYLCCLGLITSTIVLPHKQNQQSEKGWNENINISGKDPTSRHPNDVSVSYDVRFINLN